MTQKRRRRRSKKWISRLIILILIIAAVVVCYFVWDAYFKDKKETNPNKQDDSAIVQDETKEEKKNEKEEPSEEVIEKEKVVQYDGDDPNEAEGLTGAITYLKVAGDSLVIRLNIDQYLSGGSCTLSINQNGSEIYSEEAAIIDSVTTSTCEGFNVKTAKLNEGFTEVIITVSSGGKTGVIRGEVTI